MTLPRETAATRPGSEIRAVTDEEVAHLWEHGWVKLDQLISAERAARLLGRA
jgi:hypothetical protein